jgi:hypothetical protein
MTVTEATRDCAFIAVSVPADGSEGITRRK